MTYSTARLIYFSPTGTTQKVLDAIVQGLSLPLDTAIDLTLPSAESTAITIKSDQLALIGVPVYSGRVAPTALKRLQQIHGENTPAIIVAVYGNRHYDDALLELSDAVKANGFVPIAAATFIGEHSFSNSKVPIAAERPDAQDVQLAQEFGRQIVRQKPMAEFALHVPGQYPYKEKRASAPLAPETNQELCISCGTCADICPVNAIVVEKAIQTDAQQCTLCCACIKACPTSARQMQHPQFEKIQTWLMENCQDRKEPAFFLEPSYE